jgi:thioredoxin-dependent peroxiredoxin
MGNRRDLPLGESCKSAIARGLLCGLSFLLDCAIPDSERLNAPASRMTSDVALRYNDERKGETAMDVNDKAPDFSLLDQDENKVSLKDFRGKTVVLYFYPRADTPGCTKESCEFRDTDKQIQKAGAVILGISADTPKAQKKFQEKYHLPFTLLADTEKKVINAFGVYKEKNMYGKKVMGIARTTFIIGPDGKIKHAFNKVKPEGHAEQVLEYLKEAA